jgi:hypothetical protein
VDPRAGLDDVKKRKFFTQPGLELLPFGRPSRSQSLYRVRYPGSFERDNIYFLGGNFQIIRNFTNSYVNYKFNTVTYPQSLF